jgi:hypothetical protein
MHLKFWSKPCSHDSCNQALKQMTDLFHAAMEFKSDWLRERDEARHEAACLRLVIAGVLNGDESAIELAKSAVAGVQ